MAGGSRERPRKPKMVRFPPSLGDQGLVLVWWHFKSMPDYYDENGTPDHTHLFRKIASRLPAVLFSGIAAWSRVGDLS